MNKLKQACEVLLKIKHTSGNKLKQEMLKNNDSKELRFLLDTLFNSYLTYGVKEWNKAGSSNSIPDLDVLINLRKELVDRNITGSLARITLENTLNCNDEIVTECLNGVFSKELTIGVDYKTINKIYPNFIPTFEVGLCEKLLEVTKNQKILPKGNWYVEPKYDGLRGVFIIENGIVKVCSRNGKEIFNVQHIIDELHKIGLTKQEVVLDGELYGLEWNDSISIAHTESTHTDSKNLKFHIFDVLPLEEWKIQNTTEWYIDRKGVIKSLFENTEYIKVAPEYKVNSYDEAIKIYEKLLEGGYEGIVLKEEKAIYPFGRSKFWLKLKPVDTFDVKILRVEQGKGKNSKVLGAFICDLDGVEVKVGGGFKDSQRKEFWDNQGKLIGRMIEVEASPIKTKDGSLRWPVFKKFRPDKD